MKKIMSLALCLLMILSLATAAYAAVDYKITIKNNDLASAGDHVYKAYRIFTGVLDSSGTILTEIDWDPNLVDTDDFLADLKSPAETDLIVGGVNIFASATNAKEVAAVLSKSEHHTHAILSAFARIATEHVDLANPVAVSGGMTTDAGKAYYVIDIPDDMPGYYLVKDNLRELAPGEDPLLNKDISDYILQVVGEVTVEHKGSIPTMEKKVSETGNTYGDSIATGINEPHYYRILAELPDDYDVYDTYYLEFSDNFSSQLTLDQVLSVNVLIRSSGKSFVLDPTCYEIVSPASMPADGAHLRVVLEDTKQITSGGTAISLTAEDAIELHYKAHANATAIVDGNGIPNVATIIYSNDPNSDGKGESTPDETNVYPVNLKLLKVDGKATTTTLAGAEFVISRVYNEGTGSYTQYGVIVGGKIDSWVRHYAGDGCPDADTEHAAAVAASELATVLVTDDKGEIAVGGLDAGSYSLIELKAPDGYNKLAEAVQITVSATIDDAAQKISAMTGTTNQGTIAFDATKATVTVTIPNFKGDVLPSTGGVGTTVFYVIGAILVMGAAVLLVTKKRMGYEA